MHRARTGDREQIDQARTGIRVRVVHERGWNSPDGRGACTLCMGIAISAKSVPGNLAPWAAPRTAPRQRNQWTVAGKGCSNITQKIGGARGVWGTHTPNRAKLALLKSQWFYTLLEGSWLGV